MHTLLFFTLLVSVLCIVHAQNWKRAGTTRYWDCSKPHCAWHGKIPDTNPPFSHDYAFKSCNGRCAMGAKYYGTAAASTSIMGGSNQATAACAKCYALRAVGSSTPQLIVQVNNLCPGDSNEKCKRDHFDIAVPGFDWNAFSVSNTCRQSDPSINYVNGEQVCMRTAPRSCDCNRVSSDAKLVQGCKLFSELGWDNQEVDYTEVACPNLAGSPVPSPNNPRPSPNPNPPAGSCAGVYPAFDPSSHYWVELKAPASANSVQVACTGGNPQTIACENKWGKWVCKPNGDCAPDSQSPRYAIINGARCRLTGPVRAESDEESTFTEANVETFVADAAFSDNSADETFVDDASVDSAIADVNVDEFIAESNDVDAAFSDNVDDNVVDAAMSDAMLADANVDSLDAFADQSNDFAVADASAQPTVSSGQANSNSVPLWGVALIVVSAITMLSVVLLSIFVVLRMSSSRV